jgi:mannose-6-phosphate isomerase
MLPIVTRIDKNIYFSHAIEKVIIRSKPYPGFFLSSGHKLFYSGFHVLLSFKGALKLSKQINPQASIAQPLQFDPIYKQTIWGGRVLETMLGKTLPPLVKIGESWEISGVEKDQSIACTPEFSGKTLAWILQSYGQKLLGPTVKTTGEFPLLFKLIDAHDKLSVQVHPSDADANENGWGPFGKTECWYVVHAGPTAQLVVGFKKGVTKEDVAVAVQNVTLTDLLEFHDIKAGDLLFIPAGTVHAICSDTVIYEVQQTSDVTFRLYDWGRVDNAGKSRTLHVRESLQVLDTRWHSSYKVPPIPMEMLSNGSRTMRIACRYFAMEEYHFHSPGAVSVPLRKSFSVITVLDGCVAICGAHPVNLTKGMSALFPAAMQSIDIRTDSQARFLISWVPDLQQEVVDPLKKHGISSDAIAALGGF